MILDIVDSFVEKDKRPRLSEILKLTLKKEMFSACQLNHLLMKLITILKNKVRVEFFF